MNHVFEMFLCYDYRTLYGSGHAILKAGQNRTYAA